MRKLLNMQKRMMGWRREKEGLVNWIAGIEIV
jgi:hypothetical protein